MKFPERYRINSMIKDMHFFLIPYKSNKLIVTASFDNLWEHVSVSLKHRCPNWNEMSYIKDLFWDDEEECIQFHPKKSQYVNLMKYCLHIWRPPKELTDILVQSINNTVQNDE